MIYFNSDLQKRVRDLLYTSLKRYGFLALGNRETLAASSEENLYDAVDDRERIYRKKAVLSQADSVNEAPDVKV